MQSLSNSLTELEPDPEIYVDAYMTDNSLTNSEDQKQSRRQNPPRLDTTLQSSCTQNEGVLAPNSPTGRWTRRETPGTNPHT